MAQQTTMVDSFPSAPLCEHMYIQLTAQTGNIILASSDVCGLSYAQYDQTAQNQAVIRTKMHRDGNMLRQIQVLDATMRPKSAETNLEPQNLRLAGRLIGEKEVSKTQHQVQYHHDPSLSSDLMMEFHEGAANLDLSGMTLRGVIIKSAFSDVAVRYQAPNQVDMSKIEIHAAKGDIILDQIELARAKLVTVKNEMGNTNLNLGQKTDETSAIFLQNGVGTCTLEIDPNRPVKITVMRGLFSSLEVDPGFKKLEDDVYVNNAYDKQARQATIITCSTDLGSVVLKSK